MGLDFAVPACIVPVPAKVGGVMRHRHVVPHARRNLLMTSRADIGFERLVGLYAADLNWSIEA